MAEKRIKKTQSRKNPTQAVRASARSSAASVEVEKETVINIRLPLSVVEKVDRIVRRRRVRIPRHSWLLEAVYAHLDEEEDAEDLRQAENELLAIRAGRSRTYPLEEVMRTHGNLEG
jgi:predicted DNA-binding protein